MILQEAALENTVVHLTATVDVPYAMCCDVAVGLTLQQCSWVKADPAKKLEGSSHHSVQWQMLVDSSSICNEETNTLLNMIETYEDVEKQDLEHLKVSVTE